MHPSAGRHTAALVTHAFIAMFALALPLHADAKGTTKDKGKVTATWLAPVNGTTLLAPASVTLTATAEAKQSNHPIVLVEWFNGPNLIGSATAPTSGLTYALPQNNLTPGSYTLTFAATNDNGEYDETDPVTITVVKSPQTISGFSPASPIIYTPSPNNTFTLSASGGASGNAVTYSSTTNNVCTVAGNSVTVLSAGSCPLTANQAGNINYHPAPAVSAVVVINQAPQAITGFNPPSAVTFALAPDNAFLLNASGGASGNPVTFASTTPAICTAGGSHGATITIVSAGLCAVTADQLGNSNYTAAAQVAASIVVNKAAQSISGFNPPTPITFLNPPHNTFVLNGVATSGLPIRYTTATPSVCSVTSTTATILSAGMCTLTADQAGDTNVLAAPQVTANIIINKANQSITFAPTTPVSYQAAPNNTVTLSGTATSGLAVTYASTTPLVCSVTGSTATMLAAGTCTLTADQAGDLNTNAAPQVTASITVTPAAQTITGFNPPSSLTQSAGSTYLLSATGGASGNPVTFSTTTPNICTTSGSHGATLTLLATGTCTLTAAQAGNSQYAAATPVTVGISVQVQTQTQLYFIHPDHLGTPRAITKASDNTKVWAWHNDDAFGHNAPD